MHSKILKSMMTVSGLIVLSRVFGFARQILITGVIGASGSPVADAFWAAFRLPNMFRRLFAEGAFQAAFIPLFQGHHVKDGAQEAKQFAEDVLSWLIFILSLLSAVMMIFTPFFVGLLAAGFKHDPEKFNLTILYTRIMFPYLACMSLVGLCGGILNALQKFAAAAAAPLALNVCLIVGVLFFAKYDLAVTGQAAAWSVFVAGGMQLSIVLFGAWRSGFLLRWRLVPKFNRQLKRLVVLGTPGFIGAGALQINTLIGTNIASREQGAVSWLMNADQLYQLPLAVIGIALGIVLLPSISRSVKSGDLERATNKLNRGLEFAVLFVMPAAAALVCMPILICTALFSDFAGDVLGLFGVHKSAFTLADAQATGQALMIFGMGLPAFVMHKILAAAFFARENTRTPMLLALMAITVNTVVSIGLFPFLGFLSIPVGTAIAAWLEVTLLAYKLYQAGFLKPDRRLLDRIPRLTLSAVVMGAAIYLANDHQDILLPYFGGQAWGVLIAIMVGGKILYGTNIVLLGGVRLQELRDLLAQTEPSKIEKHTK